MPPGAYVYEPDGAVIRVGRASASSGNGWAPVCSTAQIAYLTADALVETPFATAFAVERVLPYDLKVLRRWVREAGVGRLEVKRRGLDVDPAQLRRDLRPHGPRGDAAAQPDADGAVALVARPRDGCLTERRRLRSARPAT